MITTNLSEEDIVKSNIATKYGVINELPFDETELSIVLENVKKTSNAIYEPLIARYGKDNISIASFYRSDMIDSLIGCYKSKYNEGLAMELIFDKSLDLNEILMFAVSSLNFDEVIIDTIVDRHKMVMRFIYGDNNLKKTSIYVTPVMNVPYIIEE
jgi:hypothetical protein